MKIEHTWYVSDSLTRDMSMAKAAGVHAVRAKYGTRYDRDLWLDLVWITHWTDEDVAREAERNSERLCSNDNFPAFTGMSGISI